MLAYLSGEVQEETHSGCQYNILALATSVGVAVPTPAKKKIGPGEWLVAAHPGGLVLVNHIVRET